MSNKDRSRYGIACCIDVETTGLSPYNNEVVELGLVLFSFDRRSGEITGVLAEYTGLREPGCPISRGASRVHGLTKGQLKGKDLARDKVLALLNQAEFIVSHNASFDYGFVAPLFPEAAAKPWYCSMNGIGWRGAGFGSKGLQNLLAAHRIEVARSHRALDDARAVVALLEKSSKQGRPYLTELLQSSPLADRAYREVAVTAGKEERIIPDKIEIATGPTPKPKTPGGCAGCGCSGCLLPVLGIVGILVAMFAWPFW